MTPVSYDGTGVTVTLAPYDTPGCHMTLVSHDGTGVTVTVASYDAPGCHMTLASHGTGVIYELCVATRSDIDLGLRACHFFA